MRHQRPPRPPRRRRLPGRGEQRLRLRPRPRGPTFRRSLALGLDGPRQAQRQQQLDGAQARVPPEDEPVGLAGVPAGADQRVRRPAAGHDAKGGARGPEQAVPGVDVAALLAGRQVRDDALLDGAKGPNLIAAGGDDAQHGGGQEHPVVAEEGKGNAAEGHEDGARGERGPAADAVGGQGEEEADDHVAGEGERHEQARLGAVVAQRLEVADEDEGRGAVGEEAREALRHEEPDVGGARGERREAQLGEGAGEEARHCGSGLMRVRDGFMAGGRLYCTVRCVFYMDGTCK